LQRSRAWLKTKNMVESEYIPLGTERDSDGVPWALLASDRDGRLEFACPAILNPPKALKAAWMERMAALAPGRRCGESGKARRTGCARSCG